MRVLLAILGMLVLGGLAYAGCFDFQIDWDDNGDGCPACVGVVCEDGNDCTGDSCNCFTGECTFSFEGFQGHVCKLDESTGVCVDGMCQEDIWCGGACDDGEECTVDICILERGTCHEGGPVHADGTVCGDGFCRDAVCVTLVDQCSVNDLAAIEAGDEPDPNKVAGCRDALGDEGCIASITTCLQQSGTSLSAECSSCFALRECCMIHECECPAPDPRCFECLQESCQPLVDACVGGQ